MVQSFSGSLAETAGYVILSTAITGARKDFLRLIEFNQLSGAAFISIEKCGKVRDAPRLLHVVGDDDDGVVSR